LSSWNELSAGKGCGRDARQPGRRVSCGLTKELWPMYYNQRIVGDVSMPLNQSERKKDITMKHIQTLNTRDMAKSAVNGGCGECQTSCQSACKTSCGIANQPCENKDAE